MEPDATSSTGIAVQVRTRSAVVVTAVLSLLLGLLASAGPAAAATAPPKVPVVTGWLPSWATDAALANVGGQCRPDRGGVAVLVHGQGVGRRGHRLDHDGRRGRRPRPGQLQGTGDRA